MSGVDANAGLGIKTTVAARTALAEMDGGAFKRKASVWRDQIKEGGRFPPESGRYHLYVSHACPWANRCLAVLKLKGLEKAIGVSVTHPTWARTRPDEEGDTHCGWVFRNPGDAPMTSPDGFGSFSCDGCVPDPHNGAKTARELYDIAGDTGGKFTVPLLWDTKKKTIVNNESSEIVVFFNSQFNAFAEHPEVDLCPAPLAESMASVDEWVYPSINNGVYRCGFAKSQVAYDTAVGELFAALDRCEEILSKQRYIAGDTFTMSDLRLFMTLVRFDEVYVVYFKTNERFIHQYEHLSGYVRELWQMKGVGSSVNMAHIKNHYFSSHPILNAYAIVPKGPGVDLNALHGRGK
jgi:putative glutathione S-transferase